MYQSPANYYQEKKMPLSRVTYSHSHTLRYPVAKQISFWFLTTKYQIFLLIFTLGLQGNLISFTFPLMDKKNIVINCK